MKNNNFWQRIWNWIKEKAIKFWEWLKKVLFNIQWITKEDYDERVEEIKKDSEEVFKKIDKDGDGKITTKDIIKWIKGETKHEKDKQSR